MHLKPSPWIEMGFSLRQTSEILLITLHVKILNNQGNGLGVVGSAAATSTRGPRFKSGHRSFLLRLYLLRSALKTQL